MQEVKLAKVYFEASSVRTIRTLFNKEKAGIPALSAAAYLNYLTMEARIVLMAFTIPLVFFSHTRAE